MLGTIAFLGAILLGMFLPHLPGRYDGLATTISFVAQVASYASLLLVPVGLVWMLNPRRSPMWWRLSLFIIGLVAFVAVFAALAVNQAALSVLMAGGALVFLRRGGLRRAGETSVGDSRSHPPATRLLLVPPVLVGCAILLLPRAADWSRDRVIRHSAPLIDAIEGFFQRHGRYPTSLQSLNRDIPTGITGVERFHYEPNGDGYNLYFIRPSIALDATEVVMYNPRDQHRFTSHELDILQFDGADLDLRRGDRRRTRLAQPYWISMLFD